MKYQKKYRLFAMMLALAMAFGLFSPDTAAAESGTLYQGEMLAAVSTSCGSGSLVNGSFSSGMDAAGAAAFDPAGFLAEAPEDAFDIYDIQTDPFTGEDIVVRVGRHDLPPEKSALSASPEADRLPAGAVEIGTRKTVVESGDHGKVTHDMECLYVGNYCTVWGDHYDEKINSKLMLPADKAKELGDSFDSNLPKVIDSFGNWFDADGDGKVAVYCFDMDQNYTYGIDGSYTAGYFWSVMMSDSRGYINNKYFYRSDYSAGSDCICIDTFPAMNGGYSDTNKLFTSVSSVFDTLVHETQHLIEFSYQVRSGNTGSSGELEDFLNEGFSMAAEHLICGSDATKNRITYYNGTSYTQGYPLTYWGSSLSNYSNSYLFGQYIRTRYGAMTKTDGSTIFKLVLEEHQKNSGVSGLTFISNLLETTPKQLILDFWAAVYLKNNSGRFGFQGETWANAIKPRKSQTDSAGMGSIGNGSAKFYAPGSMGITVQKKNNVEMLLFFGDGTVRMDSSPTVPEMTVTRTGRLTAEISFTAAQAGTLWYGVGAQTISEHSGLTGRIAYSSGKNQLTIPISSGKDAAMLSLLIEEDVGMVSGIKTFEISAWTLPDNPCGENAFWELGNDGCLSIFGSGATYDFSTENRPGWYQDREKISAVSLGEEITGLGAYLLDGCDALQFVSVPAQVTAVGSHTFGAGVQNIRFAGGAPAFAENSCAGVTANAYYDPQNVSWTDAVRTNYGGTLTWLDREDHELHQSTLQEVITPATCTAAGEGIYSCACGSTFRATIAMLGHQYDSISYEWSDDNQCTATGVCAHDAAHIVKETVAGQYALVTLPGLGTAGLERYTASFQNDLFQDQTKNIEIPAATLADGADTVSLPLARESAFLSEALLQQIEQSAAANGLEITAPDVTLDLEKTVLHTLADHLETGGKLRMEVSIDDENLLTQEQQSALDALRGKGDAVLISLSLYAENPGSEPEALHELGGSVRVKVPYPAEKVAGKTVTVCYLAENGDLEYLSADYADGNILFETAHFSQFAVLAQAELSDEIDGVAFTFQTKNSQINFEDPGSKTIYLAFYAENGKMLSAIPITQKSSQQIPANTFSFRLFSLNAQDEPQSAGVLIYPSVQSAGK